MGRVIDCPTRRIEYISLVKLICSRAKRNNSRKRQISDNGGSSTVEEHAMSNIKIDASQASREFVIIRR